MRLTLEVFGETVLDRDLQRIASRVGDADPAMHALGQFFMRVFKKQFDRQGAYGPGGKWQALKQSTIDRKKALNLDPRILHATLDLRKSLTEEGADNQIFIHSGGVLHLGSTLPYGKYHQTGTRTGLPKRRIADLTKAARVDAAKVVQEWVMTGRVRVPQPR